VITDYRGIQSMDVQCPRCGAKSIQADSTETFPCSSCGVGLEIIESGSGLTIVGIKKEGTSRGQDKPSALAERNDPVIDGYTKWQEGAIFFIALGIACGFVIFIDLKSLYQSYGYYFWKNSQNLSFLYIVGPFMFICFIGGIWIFRFSGRMKKRYRETESKQGERQENERK
jgi:ribosomal protein S27AE